MVSFWILQEAEVPHEVDNKVDSTRGFMQKKVHHTTTDKVRRRVSHACGNESAAIRSAEIDRGAATFMGPCRRVHPPVVHLSKKKNARISCAAGCTALG